MIREHAKLFTALQFSTDLGLSGLAFLLAYFTRLHLNLVVPRQIDHLLNPELHHVGFYWWWMIGLALPLWAMAAFSLGLYKLSVRPFDWKKIRIVLESSILLGLFLGFLSFALKLEFSRPLIFLFVAYQAAFLTLARLAVRVWSRGRAYPSPGRRNIMIVGTGAKAQEMAELLSRYSEWGLRLVGFVISDEKRPNDLPDRMRVLGTVADIPQLVENHVVDEIMFVGSGTKDLACLEEILPVCREQGIRTRVAADLFPAKVSKVSMEFMENVPILTFSATPDHPFPLFVKRAMDVGISLSLFILLSPLMALIVVLVKLTSRGPIIYRQLRCGLYGRRFTLYKFRSMQEGAEDVLWEIRHLNEMDGPVFKMRNDPRVTPLGRFLRKSSMDELPQFWNVLKGDMSLVGPRAPLPEEVKEYTRWQRRRLSVKPGITCLWQVSGRNEIDFHEWMKLDLHYIDNWSLLLDLKILLRTFPVVLLGKGAR